MKPKAYCPFDKPKTKGQGLLRNAILELLKSGKAEDLLEMGTLYIKPSSSMDSLNPSINDVPDMTLSFTPSDIALEAVKGVTVGLTLLQQTSLRWKAFTIQNQKAMNFLSGIQPESQEKGLRLQAKKVKQDCS